MINVLEFNRFNELNEKSNTPIDNSEYWTLITIMACENYSDQKQGMADTAQSIYNRLAVPKKPYGKTIKEIILYKGQYEPVSSGKKRGANWDSINSKDKAIVVYMKTRNVDRDKATLAINNSILAQKDVKLSSEAGKYIQSRTEFLADKPKSSGAAKPVERQSNKSNNAFFWNYSGKTHFYSKNDLTPKSKPENVNVA